MCTSEPIRVMIAEDHPLFGHGLHRVLSMEPDIEVIAEVQDGDSAVRCALELHPDVVLMDVNMPERNGLQATHDITAAAKDIAVIVLTAYDDEEQLLFAVRAGASAYFAKDVRPEVLIEAIRAVYRGKYVLGNRVLDEVQVMRGFLSQADDLSFAGSDEGTLMPLTAREMEIIELIARGASNKVIALTLNISQQTVKNHMTSILRKLSVNDRTEAAVVALRRGWIRLQDTKEPPLAG